MEHPPITFSPLHASIADFIQWHRRKELELNPEFQRRPVWTQDAKSFFIDSILLGYSTPKIYLRTMIDPKSQTAIRDVVDGQQRLRAIFEFADNTLVLNRRSPTFQGMNYDELSDVYKEAFLGYTLSIEHLINANDNAVLETFTRLNTNTVSLNPAELRHAIYDSDLRWLVVWLSQDLRWFVEKYTIFTVSTIMRMQDDAFFAELVNIQLNGIGHGGAAVLNTLYRNNLGELPNGQTIRDRIIEAVEWADQTIGPIIGSTPLQSSHQVMMILSAYTYIKYDLPKGSMTTMPPRTTLASAERIRERLLRLADAIASEDRSSAYRSFVEASSKATTRISSRSVRFTAFVDALSAR